MTPIVNGLEAEFSGEINVLRLNAAEPDNDQLMREYGLRGHPSFVVLDDTGRVAQTFFGPQTAAQFRTAIQDVLQ